MQSHDVIGSNTQKIAQLFPNCVTERLGKDGKPELAIDFEKLQAELSNEIIEAGEERYQFTWPDKRAAARLANTPTSMTLRPCREESVDFDKTQNLYIEGDNLDVLKVLRETYLGKVKMIYIDPPYNTGNDFVYNDDFAQGKDDFEQSSGLFDEEGNQTIDPMQRNTESNGRFHTDWLNMIYPRLKVARDLLTDDGVIFISIDDNEVENLKKVCDEIFGEVNSQSIISYVRKTSGKQDSSNFMKSTEFILCYSKSELWSCQPIVAGEQVLDRYNKVDESGNRYRETDLRKTGNADRRIDRPLMYYPFYYNPIDNDLQVRAEDDYELEQNGYIKILPIKPDGTDGRWRWGVDNARAHIDFLVARLMPKYKEQNKYTIYEKDYIDKKGEIRTVKEHTSWDRTEFNSDNAMMEFKRLGFSNQLFPFPKVSSLIKHMCYLADTQNSVILDFFSGSATTAHAVMQLNAEDGGNRRFIMAQLPELTDEKSEAYISGYKNICEIGKERIRRAGAKINEELGVRNEELGTKLDVGFRVLKLDSSNMKDVYYTPQEFELQSLFNENVKDDRTNEDLLFQVMLDLGIELSAKIETKQIAGKTVYFVDDNYLVACFDRDANESTITEIAKEQPIYFVMRDASAANDNVIDNFDQIFRHYSPDTTCRII